MKVSVLVPTYNQRHYIQECLDSLLAQQYKSVEILVGDDGSEDGTTEIVKKYGEAFPGKIRVFFNDHRNRATEKGKASGSANFVNLLHQAQGEYIAICEGDDYWLDPLKLQRQVEFLDQNPVYTACSHDVAVVNESGEEKYIYSKIREYEEDRDFTLGDFIAENPVPTASLIFRNKPYIQELPEWFFQFPFGDWPLLVLNVMHGPIRYLHYLMAAYRIHSASSWSRQSKQYRYSAVTDFRFFLNHLLERRYEAILKEQIVKDVVRVQEDYDRVANDNIGLRQAYDRAIDDCDGLKKDICDLKQAYDRAINDCDVLKKDICDLKQAYDRAISDYGILKEAFDHALSDYNALKQAYDRVTEEN